MLKRVVITLALIVAAVTALAWPVSMLGVGYSQEAGGTRRIAWLTGGVLRLSVDQLPPPKAVDRPRLNIQTGRAPDVPRRLWPVVLRSPTTSVFILPLWCGLAGPVVLLAGAAAARRVRLRRRRSEGGCLACGYARPGPVGACPECGLSVPEAAARARIGPGRLVRDAAIGVCAVLMAASLGAWGVAAADEHAEIAHRAAALDYSWYLEACGPRLDGSVMFATPGPGPDSINSAVGRAAPGTTIVLLPGRHELGDLSRRSGPKLKDLWIVGCGAGTTTLTSRIEGLTRVRIEDVAIDCADEPFCELREQGSLALRNCRIFGYNSGAGGSNAVFGVDTALLIEGCEFEGKTGRAAAMMRGEALDIRGECRVFVRASRFIDNQHIFRSADGVLDRCTITTDQPQFNFPPGGGNLLAVQTVFGDARSMPGPRVTAETLDDPAALRRLAAGESARRIWSDPVIRDAAGALGFSKNGTLWNRLLAHPSAEVREIARGRAELAPAKPLLMTTEAAMAGLDSPYLKADAVLAVLAAGESVRTRLEGLRASGRPNERGNAAAVLRLMDLDPPFSELLRAQAGMDGR